MCGRYTIGTEQKGSRILKILAEADASLPPGLCLTAREGGDIYPTDLTSAIVGSGGEPRAVGMRWGFKTERGLVINARAETALERPLFRESALERRCLLPALGFYEWNAHKERFLLRRPDGGLLYLAGLYREGEDGIPAYVILTRRQTKKRAPSTRACP